MSEAHVQRDIINALLTHGWMVLRVNALRLGPLAAYYVYPTSASEGCSDIIAFRESQAVFIECKSASGTQRRSQRNFQRICYSYHMPYIIARSTNDIAHLCTLNDASAETASPSDTTWSATEQGYASAPRTTPKRKQKRQQTDTCSASMTPSARSSPNDTDSP